jgi:hypothetical protein
MRSVLSCIISFLRIGRLTRPQSGGALDEGIVEGLGKVDVRRLAWAECSALLRLDAFRILAPWRRCQSMFE